MTSLSARAVSLSDHVKRRRNNTSSSANSNGSSGNEAFGASSGGGSSSSSNSPLKTYVPQHHPMNTEYHPNTTTTTTTTHRPPLLPIGGGSVGGNEGGYDSHVASYGNYDAPSLHCRSYHASEHGCYAVESHMGFIPRRSHNATSSNSNSSSSSSNKVALGGNHTMARLGSYSNPLLDLEDQRYICSSSRQRRTTNTATLASSSPRSGSLDQTPELLGGGGRRRILCQDNNTDSSSFCSNALTASTASSSGSSSNNNSNSNSAYSHHSMDASCCAFSTSASSIAPPTLDEDAIRQGILDFSTLVATYLAGALSFLIGIFLTLLSPLIKIIKCIVGDVRGLLGDAGFLHELGSLWRLYRDLRRSSERSSSQYPHHHPYSSNTTGGDYHYYNHHYHPSPRYNNHHQDDTSLEDGSTTVCSAETSTQFVGGWRPHVCPSVGSGCGASSVNTPSINMGGGTVRSSSSSSSWGAGGGVVAMNASPRPLQHVSSSLPLGQDGGIRPGAGDGHSISTTTSKKNDEVSSCPPQMTWHQQTAQSCSESRPYYNPSSRGSSGNHVYARRSTDLSNHQSPSFPPRTTTMQQQQYGCPPYPQAPPQNRYPRSKSDVVS